MRIEEKDFKIEYDGTQFTLYLLKSKKEMKEDAKDTYKIGGYFTNIYFAFYNALQWRQHKKYPFSEPIIEFKKDLKKYKKSINELKETSNMLYAPIFTFKKFVFDEDKSLQSRIE